MQGHFQLGRAADASCLASGQFLSLNVCFWWKAACPVLSANWQERTRALGQSGPQLIGSFRAPRGYSGRPFP